MRVPTKIVSSPDWEAVFNRIEHAAPLVFEDMTQKMARAFNIWCRDHKGVGISTRSVSNGLQVTIGSTYPDAKRRPLK